MITSNYDPPAWPWYYGTVYKPEEYETAAAGVQRLANSLYSGAEGADTGGPDSVAAVPDISRPKPDTRKFYDISQYKTVEMQGKPDVQTEPVSSMYYFMPGYAQQQKQKVPLKKAMQFDILRIRADFPILQRQVNGRQLIWLDNSATTQKPKCVMDALTRYYSECNSNVHRGAHTLSHIATSVYEEARGKACAFLGASSNEEIIFVRGTTEAINLVAHSWGNPNLKPGDEIIITAMEHHSNIVPWQMLAERTGAIIKAAPIDERGMVILDGYERLFSPRTRLVAMAHVSNTLGTVNPVRRMSEIAHMHGAVVLVDGAQSTPHMPINVKEMDADFFAFSGHKVYGPTGIGVLYGKKQLLESMPPYQGGGGMIKDVHINNATYTTLPGKFEAGTGNIADAVGLGAALDYLKSIGMEKVHQYETELTSCLMDAMGGGAGSAADWYRSG
jgi:cysteine desulfurase/selenocysteine lyase